MERCLANELKLHAGEQVKLAGWLHQMRRMGGINFLVLRDRAGTTQVVVDQESALAPLQGLLPETVLEVVGTVVAEAQAPGGFELHNPQFTVLSPVNQALPFSINKPELKVNLDTFLDHAAVGLRHPNRQATLRLANGVMAGFRQTLRLNSFTEVTSPKIAASATESGANVFAIDYFGRPAYLAQSPQFYKQLLTAVFERVFEVAPVFRAEPHDTTRHLAEYVSLDAEFAFIQDHTTVMAMLNTVILGILTYLKENNAADLERLKAIMPQAPDQFPSIYFPEAQELIYKLHGVDVRGEPDLSPQGERWLGAWAKAQFNSDFLFVTGYPMAKRPFYTHPNPADPRYSNSFDLLFRGVELVTGGQRLHLYQDYIAVLHAKNMSPEPFEYYLEGFKYGMAPHGGWAIGLERFVTQLLGLSNVREATIFPRDLNRVTP